MKDIIQIYDAIIYYTHVCLYRRFLLTEVYDLVEFIVSLKSRLEMIIDRREELFA